MNAILSLAFGRPYAMVDSNVNQVISRALCGKDPVPHITKGIRELAERVLPAGRHREQPSSMPDMREKDKSHDINLGASADPLQEQG